VCRPCVALTNDHHFSAIAFIQSALRGSVPFGTALNELLFGEHEAFVDIGHSSLGESWNAIW
jgi:hypothetical protein